MAVFVLSAGIGAAGACFWKSRPHASSAASTSAKAGGDSDSAAQNAAPPESGRLKSGPPPSLEELRAAGEKDRLPLLVRWLASADAAQVAALAQEWVRDGKDSGDLFWQVLAARWVELDAAAAVSYGRRLAADYRKIYPRSITPLYYVYLALGRVDRAKALSLLASESAEDIGMSADALEQVLGQEAMRDWALALPGHPELDSLRHRDLSSSAPLDLKHPAETAARLSSSRIHSQGGMLVGEWAKTDPAAALAWANGQENGFERSKLLAAIATTLAGTDPAKAAEIIKSLPPGPSRANAGAAYAAALAKKDPEAAEAWTEANLQGAARLLSLAAIAGTKAEANPAAALKMLRENGIGDISSLLNV